MRPKRVIVRPNLGGASLLAGATAMYFFDPEQGARRRAHFRHRIIHTQRVSTDFLSKAGRDIANRAHGIVYRFGRLGRAKPVSAPVLIDRVRAALGRCTSHAHAISVKGEEGHITLSGPVLAKEKDAVISCARRVRGVQRVTDALAIQEEGTAGPPLAGVEGQTLPPHRFDLAQHHWTPSVRVLAALFSGALAITARQRRGPLAAVLFGAGAGLGLRSATNLPLYRMLGIGAGRRAIDVHKTISISAPIEEVFAICTNVERLPLAMEHVRGVRTAEDGRSRWTVAGPLGMPVSYVVELTTVSPNDVIAWKTVEGSAVRHEGTARFERQPDATTRIDFRLSYNPVAGALGHAIAKLFRVDPKRALDADLVRLKSLLEQGKTRAHHRVVALEELRGHSRREESVSASR